jgi:hypothetical protein
MTNYGYAAGDATKAEATQVMDLVEAESRKADPGLTVINTAVYLRDQIVSTVPGTEDGEFELRLSPNALRFVGQDLVQVASFLADEHITLVEEPKFEHSPDTFKLHVQIVF